jgi:hypothetical protein
LVSMFPCIARLRLQRWLGSGVQARDQIHHCSSGCMFYVKFLDPHLSMLNKYGRYENKVQMVQDVNFGSLPREDLGMNSDIFRSGM